MFGKTLIFVLSSRTPAVVEAARRLDLVLGVDELGRCSCRKFWLACSCGYASATANRLFSACLDVVLGGARLGRSPALSVSARALVTFSKTAFSWAA